MSINTVPSPTPVSCEFVAGLILSSPSPNVAIIDVRDADHVGGHIKGSTWVPSNELGSRMPELLQTLKDKDRVIFHCGLSQQRGPNAALRYARERGRPAGKLVGEPEPKGQEVCVLVGGFNEWQAKYGDDERLTEDYAKDLWQ